MLEEKMAEKKSQLMEKVKKVIDETENEELVAQKITEAVSGEFPDAFPAAGTVGDTVENFHFEEIPEVLSELILTATAGCSDDEFHSWNYDHLEFIIDLSNRFGFAIPKNFLNGLPEQLILLVKADHLKNPSCD